MIHLKLFSILFFISASQIHAQLKIEYEDKSLTLHQVNTLETPIPFNAPSQPDEEEAIGVFKTYFNPASFEHYKSYFLAEDWMGLSPAGFQEWQDFIHTNRLYLIQTLYLRGTDQVEYLILQYTMESPMYSVPASTEFKKVNGEWKHTNVNRDFYGASLSKTGLIHPVYIQDQFKARGQKINLLQPGDFTKWTYEEKFSRSTLIEPILDILRVKGIHDTDVSILKNYFLQKDNAGFIQYITDQYRIDHWDLMDTLNTSVGFTLFNFSRPQND